MAKTSKTKISTEQLPKKMTKTMLFINIFGRFFIVIVAVLAVFLITNIINNHRKNSEISVSFSSDNKTIESIISQRPITTLVGNFNQTNLFKKQYPKSVEVLPLLSCNQPIKSLANTNWRQQLKTENFAYIFSTQPGKDGFTNCSLAETETIYGVPNSKVLVSGTLLKPSEDLLFYNHAVQKKVVLKKSNPLLTPNIIPLPISVLMAPTCSGTTTMLVVAHEDDDLLFMNPDLVNQIQSGNCVRSLFLTAGDDGGSAFYWLGRQEGSEAAYAAMLGINNSWIEKTVELTPTEFITLATPIGNTKISLVFFHLPDGNLQGQGFKDTDYQSLHKLYTGTSSTINSVDGQSSYTSTELTSAIQTLMNFYKPTQIWTQSSYIDSSPDHSDHATTGKFTTQALNNYNQQTTQSIPVTYYLGYQMNSLPSNVTGVDSINKQLIFKQYAEFDKNICATQTYCQNISTYKNYFSREYTWAY